MATEDEVKGAAGGIILEMMHGGETEDITAEWLKAKDIDEEEFIEVMRVAGDLFGSLIHQVLLKTIQGLLEEGEELNHESIKKAVDKSTNAGAGTAASVGFRIGFTVAEKRMLEGHMGGTSE